GERRPGGTGSSGYNNNNNNRNNTQRNKGNADIVNAGNPGTHYSAMTIATDAFRDEESYEIRDDPDVFRDDLMPGIAAPCEEEHTDASYSLTENGAITHEDVIVDSGCSNHCFNDEKWFKYMCKIEEPNQMKTSNGGSLSTEGQGTVNITTDFGNLTLDSVSYAPQGAANMLSPGMLRRKGIVIDGYKDMLVMKETGEPVSEIFWKKDVAVLKHKKQDAFYNFATLPLNKTTEKVEYGIMHRRLAHAGPERVIRACHEAGIRIDTSSLKNFHCETCHLAKADSMINRTPMVEAKQFLGYVFWDIIEHKPVGYGNFKYTLHGIDVYTGYHWIFFLQRRDQALPRIKDWLRSVHNMSNGYRVQVMGFDSASEFTSEKILSFSREEGFVFRHSPPYTSEQNGNVERAGRLLMESGRAICIETKLPELLWPLYMEASVYVNNRLPTRSNKDFISPIHAMFQAIEVPYTPYLQHIRTWGCVAYVRIPEAKRVRSQKMAPRAWKGRLVGMEGNRGHIYKVWIPEQSKVVRARDVRFREIFPDMEVDDREADHEAVLVDPEIVDGGRMIVQYASDFMTEPDGTPEETENPPQRQQESQSRQEQRNTQALTGPQFQHPQERAMIYPEEYDDLDVPITPAVRNTTSSREAGRRRSRGNRNVEFTVDPQPAQRGQQVHYGRFQAGYDTPHTLSQTTGVVNDWENLRQKNNEEMSSICDNIGRWGRTPPASESPVQSLVQTPASRHYDDDIEMADAPWQHVPGGFIDTPQPRRTAEQFQTPIRTPNNPIPQEEPRRPEPPTRSYEVTSLPPATDRELRSRGKKNDLASKMRGNAGLAVLSDNYRERDEIEEHTKHYVFTTIAAEQLEYPKFPKNQREAHRRDNYNTWWKPAEVKQFNSLIQKQAWELVDRPPGAKVLDGKWVYDEKYPQDADPYARARWVVRGDQERDDYEPGEIYAAVAHIASVRLFLSIAAILDLEIGQCDAVTAFLNSEVKKEVYVAQPYGFEDGTKRVCKLKRALYGLAASPAWWFETASSELKSIGFEPLSSEVCIFVRDDGVMLILYVDDMGVAARTKDIVNGVIDEISQLFEIKRLGDMKDFLGLRIVRDRAKRHIYIHQQGYTEKILQKFTEGKLNSVKTPWPSKLTLPANWKTLDMVMKPSEWLERTGSLNYLSMGSRPDITFTVQKLCEGNCNPTETHNTILKHLFRYLEGTKDYATRLGGEYNLDDFKLRVYADAAFADDKETRCSTAGHVLFLGDGPIFWKSKRQSLVTTSTTEAEFINLTPAGVSLLWFSNILKQAKLPQRQPFLLYTDSQNARESVLNKYNQARTRHIDLRYKWIIHRTDEGYFQLEHVGTGDMIADGMTKPLMITAHEKFVRQLGLGPPKGSG
ncbi:Gag-Pol poly, partial [Fusarium albosuccineum]